MSRKLMYVAWVALAGLSLATVAQAGQDVTQPGDPIVAIPNNGNWPGNEQVPQAIDNQITTKYLHFEGATQPTGLAVTPSMGATVVTALNLCTANDAIERDPVAYELSGSNDSIDGPWTVIASGPISEWAAADPGRRVWLSKPIAFANTVSYKHYRLMFPTCRGPGQNSMQIAEIELLMDVLQASKPDPADGATGIVMPLLRWTPGDKALFEDVYIGTSPELTDADRIVTHQPAAVKMAFYAKGLASGQTYYWRVDDFDAAGNVYTGNVWTFTAVPLKAYGPTPRDGAKWVDVETDLSWQPGQGATKHDLYFGTDQAAVEARDASVFQGTLNVMLFELDTLAANTTYYWVVDESGVQNYPGDVWRFTTVGGGGGLKGEYFGNDSLTGLPALTRIDSAVNINTDASPGGTIPADGWSARWTADLEILFADTYQFSVNCQDGTRLWIDGRLIIDQWVNPTVTSEYFAVPIRLEPGIHSLVLEFVDYSGTAVEELYWSTPTMAKVLVPAGPLQPPVRARALYPADGDVNVPQDTMLTWSAGEKAAAHDVYFGTDRDAVAAADTSSPLYQGQQALDEASFDPGLMEWNTTYYWRVDEVNDAESDSPWQAGVWEFTTADFLVVDNFESYNDEEGQGTRIYETWIDGWTNGTGSVVGNLNPPFAEQTIVHSGAQSMPLDYNNIISPYYSEAEREFSSVQDWTVNGITDLVLWVRGNPIAFADNGDGSFILSGCGNDIWNNADAFRFAYKRLNGDGSIIARVDSQVNTDGWTKAGVMIRETLDAGSKHAFVALTPSNGVSFQRRDLTDGASSNFDSVATPQEVAPYWVKLTRTGNTFKAECSADGKTWQLMDPADATTSSLDIMMVANVYVGLAVTAHNAARISQAEFSNVATTGTVTGQWQTADIGTDPEWGNAPDQLYVVVEDSSGNIGQATNAEAVNAPDWTEWRIPLSGLGNVNAAKVKKLYIGVGDRDNPVPAGAGRVYIDDIRVMKP